MNKLLLVSFDEAESGIGAGFAQALGLPYEVLQLTGNPGASGGTVLHLLSLSEVPPADAISKLIAELAAGFSHIAAISSMRSKDILARVAGILDAAMVTDVVGMESPTYFHRPVVAGSVVAHVEMLASPVVITFRPANFSGSGEIPSDVRRVETSLSGSSVRLSTSSRGTGRPDLSQAKIVVSGGRPLKDSETFERVIGGFADALGAAVGATRAAVDSGIAPNELQVGQTGKVVAPDLYIAAGISGSTQHMAGIKDSKVIVAINKDGDAPIFEQADLGIVGDLFDVLPALQEELLKRRS